MRPVELSLMGLHSYKERVDIDFNELGRYGLFGIFGRIGSGKSTLLDAMTLALYGLVDRVSTRSRKGLVNLGSKGCEVRFRFAIDHPHGIDLYEIHRAFKEVDGALQRTGSRLLQLSSADGERKLVLAEREAEVTQTIEDIVGLGHDDFIRVVVLPQGKFSALLQLKGQDRRQMLQRIFRLQAYGEDLRGKVRERLDTGRARKLSIQGELYGMGDASERAIKAAEEAAKLARARRQSEEESHRALSARMSEASRIRAEQSRRLHLESELRAHLAAEPEISRLEETLAREERARPLVSLARRRLQQLSALASAEALLTSALQQERPAVEREQQARQAAAEARRSLEAREPSLSARIHQMESARALEIERDRLSGALEAHRARESAAQQATDSAQAQLSSARARLDQLEAEIRKLRREYARSRVSADEREAVARAQRAAERVQSARRELDAAKREEEAARDILEQALRDRAEMSALLEEARAAVAQAERLAAERSASPDLLDEAELRALDARIAGRERAWLLAERAASEREHARGVLAAASASAQRASLQASASEQALAEAERARADAEGAFASASEAVTSAQRLASAKILADGLTEGDPCPVCGSTSHPHKPTHDLPLPDADLQRARRALDAAKEALDAARSAHARASAARDLAEEALRAAHERARALEAEPFEEPAALSLAIEQDKRAKSAYERASASTNAALSALGAAKATLEQRERPAAAAAEREAARRADLDARIAALAARSADADRAWVAFDTDRGELSLLEIPSAGERIAERDRRCEQLTSELAARESELLAYQAEADALGRALERGRADLDAARTAGAELVARDAELERQISAITGGQRAQAALELLQPELAALRSAEQLARQEAQAAERDREQSARRAALARADAARARAELEATDAEMAASAEGSPWPGISSLGSSDLALWLAARPADPAIAEMRGRISSWKTRRAALDAAVAALGHGERPMSDEAFLSLQASFDASNLRLDEAKEQVAVSVRIHADLLAKAPRFTQLTSESGDLDRDLGRLDELNNLLRGDRFVEYVANDHLDELCLRASEHLRELTGGRYGLALDEELAFMVLDEEAGGRPRPVHTLSGGESFLTALSLALSLSSKVQERSRRPLGFFFLDEGFGTLDPEALDRVMTAIEALRDESRIIGLISHLPAIRERVPRYLWVEMGPGGSRVKMIDT